MRRLFATLSLVLFFGPVHSDEIEGLAEGLEAYEFFCSKCHGKDMVNAGVSSYDLRKFPKNEKQRFYDSVNLGRGNMPAWGDVIYPEELDALWIYVSTRGGTEPLVDQPPSDDEDPASDLQGKIHYEIEDAIGDLVEPGQLTVCLARNAGAISGYRIDGGSGLDFVLAQALADHLQLELHPIWFESEPGEEGGPVTETYAMLSHGLCDMVPSHPLYQNAVGAPALDSASLPRWLGMPETRDPETERLISKKMPFVSLKPIDITQPYMRAEIGLVYQQQDREPAHLKDLQDRVVGYQQGTLSGALLQISAPQLLNNARSFNPGSTFLWEVETGEADVALVDVAAYDGHRKHNSITRLKLAKWRHPVGLDIGIAVLSDNMALLSVLNQALDTLMQGDALVSMAQTQGVTYTEPRNQGIEPPFSWRSLKSKVLSN